MVLLTERASKLTILLTIFAERTDDKTPKLKQAGTSAKVYTKQFSSNIN